MATCPHCGVENPPASQFCNACGAQLVDSPAETRRIVTVLFSDVTGSTSLGERSDPESVRGVMVRYFEEMQAILERHGGTVEKFIGDAVMAVFGIPVLHEDDALRAVRAAVEMRDALVELNEELERDRGVRLETRIGVNTGEVVAGDPGSGHRFATGDVVNTAKRLEENARPGSVLIGEPTFRLVRDAVDAEPVEPLRLRGKASETEAFRVLRAESASGRAQGSPFVGRRDEFELLRDAFSWAVEQRACHLFTLLGALGVGKSRLTDEFTAAVAGEATVIHGRCLSYGEGITFWPLAEAVREAADLRADESVEDARAKLASLLEGEENAPLVAERISQLIGLSDALAGGEESFWAARRFFEALARKRPLVVVFEDLHWAEPTFLDLVEHIPAWTRDAPILLLCLARPELLELRPQWGSRAVNTTVLLEPLHDEDAVELVEGALGGPIDAQVREAILRSAEGNALFLEESLALLVDEGLVERADGGWRATGRLADVPLPPTIQALLASRLDRLSAKERAVVEAASVEGRVFHRGAVAELVPAEHRAEVGAQLLRLVRQELVWPARSSLAGDEAYRFRHLLVRDTAYGAIPKERRAGLHERFAGWVEDRAGARAGEYDELVGYHLEQAYRNRAELRPPDEQTRELAARAGGLLERAGRRAFARDDVHAASSLLDRALALLPQDGVSRLEAERELSMALWALGDAKRADTVLTGVLEAAVARGDRQIEWYARLEQAGRRNMADPDAAADELLRAAEQAIEIFEEAGDDLGLARAWRRLSVVARGRCHYGQGEEAITRALAHAQGSGDGQEEARCADGLCTCLLYGPAPAEAAIARCEEMLERSRGNRLLEANVMSALAGLHAVRGRFDEARALADRARTVYTDLGLTLPLAGLEQIAGDVELLAEDFPKAEELYRRPYDVFAEMGAKGLLANFAATLGRAVYLQGRVDEARELADVGRGAGKYDIATRVLSLGLCALLAEDRQEGVQLAGEGVELAAQTDALNMHGSALLDLADVLRSAGEETEAAVALRDAQEVFDRKGNVVSARQTAARLAQPV